MTIEINHYGREHIKTVEQLLIEELEQLKRNGKQGFQCKDFVFVSDIDKRIEELRNGNG